MKKYLLRIKPMEPFTFGGENGFSFKEIAYEGKYYMESKKYPEQTTIIGLIRYLILQSEGKLNQSYHYTEDKRREMALACGEHSFSFEPSDIQDFGFIKEISPLFLLDSENHIYIKNPFCNKTKVKGFQPIELSNAVECSIGDNVLLPPDTADGYHGKTGYAKGLICISQLDNEDVRIQKEADFFKSQMIAGNRKDNESNQDGFFRREVISMKERDSAFGVYVTLDDQAKDLEEQTIAYMGKKSSAFQVKAIKVSNDTDLDSQVIEFFATFQTHDKWHYCLSDVLPNQEIHYKNFSIVETKCLRNLKTDYSEKRMTRTKQKRYYLIAAGSAFYKELPEELVEDSKQLRNVGYNHIITIGGK